MRQIIIQDRYIKNSSQKNNMDKDEYTTIKRAYRDLYDYGRISSEDYENIINDIKLEFFKGKTNDDN